jgi:hydroxymethylpyrimidine pyrophosphatase-like HAD family hydrolase
MTPTTAPTPTVPTALPVGVSSGPALVALDIDGTLTEPGGVTVPERTAAAVAAVVAAGHHVVLSSGRSLAGVMPIADALDLNGWVCASNGAVIGRRWRPRGTLFELHDVRTLDTRQVVTAALVSRLPGLAIGVEEVGRGYYVSEVFPAGELRGDQTVLPVHELGAITTPRIVLRAPGVLELVEPLRAVGLTVNPGASDELIDVTPPDVSKASALETVRRRLRVARGSTVAVGDGVNDLDAFGWAAWSVAMGHAPAKVREAADHVTGTLDEHGAAIVLDVLAALSAGAGER